MKSPLIQFVIFFTLLCCSTSYSQQAPTKWQEERARAIASEIAQKANEKIRNMSPTSTVLCHSGLTHEHGYQLEDYQVEWSQLGSDTMIVRYQHKKGGSEIIGALTGVRL